MFDIDIHFEDIIISSIEKEDILAVQRWINKQNLYGEENLNKPLHLEEMIERFLEYYMSENEFFLKIEKENNIIGIFKGRIEFKNPNEILIWCYVIDSEFRRKGLGTKILNNILDNFRDGYGINCFSTSVMDGSPSVIRFWKKNKFYLLRVSKDFFNIEGKLFDMFILKRED